MKIILTRHGETIENRKGLLQGHNEGTLSALGKEQARKLATRLRNERIDFIYSSDLNRAAATAREIARFHNNIPLEYTEMLRERHFGEFQGKRRDEIGWDNTKSSSSIPEPEKGESIEQVYLRARSFIQTLYPLHPSETVLLVSHGFIGKTINAFLTGKGCPGIKAIDSLKNTSVSIFDYRKEDQIIPLLIDCTSHLD